MLIRRGLVTDLFELSRLWSHMVQESEDLLPNLEMWRGYIVNLMGYKGYFMWVAEEDNERLASLITPCSRSLHTGYGLRRLITSTLLLHIGTRKSAVSCG